MVCSPARSRLGDAIIAAANACVLAERGGIVEMRPQSKLLAWPVHDREYSIAGLKFAVSLFRHDGLQFNPEPFHGRTVLLPKLPMCDYQRFSRFKRDKLEVRNFIAFDFAARTGYNRPSNATYRQLIRHLSAFGLVMDASSYANAHGLMAAASMLRRSLCFVGVDSGMAHVAHAVGTPSHLIRFNGPSGRLERWHRHQSYSLYADANDFCSRFDGAEIPRLWRAALQPARRPAWP